jgi:hypothetical protein
VTDILDITYEVFIDWGLPTGAYDWAAAPSFTLPEDDISDDVSFVGLTSGKNAEAGNTAASTWEIRLRPEVLVEGVKTKVCLKYSPFNAAGPLYGRLLPMRHVRARALYDGNYYLLFTGFISGFHLEPDANSSEGAASIYCTDGLDILARQIVNQDYDNRQSVDAGGAIGLLADTAGWPETLRSFASGDTAFEYPESA